MEKQSAVTCQHRAPEEESTDEPPDSTSLAQVELFPEPLVLPLERLRIEPDLPGPDLKRPKGRVVRPSRISYRVRAFRRIYYRGVSEKEWNDWRWQMRHRIRTSQEISRLIRLTDDEREALDRGGSMLPAGITPYYMSLVSPDEPSQPIRRTVIPTTSEFLRGPGEADDPLGEERQSPVEGLVHRYPDRVLLLVHDICTTYCRYCTRARVVGQRVLRPDRGRLEKAFAYIRSNPCIRDVLISGGDPLVLEDEWLFWILSELRSIPHVEILRIGTKIPVTLPQRIRPPLIRMLRRFHPLWMSIHFTHPDECTEEVKTACGLLADGGIPLGSQTVLLKGINDNVDTMRSLLHRLMMMRVRPYYLYQCDPISGSAHFRTSVEKGLSILAGLRGFTTGYAIPTYVVDAPGGGGKIPLMPDPIVARQDDHLVLRNHEGLMFQYPDPSPQPVQV